MMVGLRAPFSAQLLLPPRMLTYFVYVCLIVLFLFGAFKARRRDTSILYVVVAVFPLVYALSPKTALALSTPRFILVLSPVLVLLLAQVATNRSRAAATLALVCVVSTVTLQRMNNWFAGVPRPTTQARGLGPRDTVQLVPRSLAGLTAGLNRLGIDHVYADYWLAYRLDFDTQEHITAVENRFAAVTFEDGQAVPSSSGQVRYPPYARAVRQARHGFIFYRKIVGTVPIIASLKRHGYRRHVIGSFVVYAPPPG